MVVGIPGLLLALLVSRMKEPVRGMSEGGSTPWTTHAHPFRETGHELLTVLPGINFLCLIAQRAGAGLITANLVAALASAAAFFSLYRWLGNPGQWIALGVAVYCAFTWGQSLSVRKPEVFRAIFRTPTVVLSCIAFPLMSLVSYGTGFWIIPYITGVISTKLSEGGMNPIESLRRGVLALFVFDCVAIVLLLIACRTIGRDQARIRELAAAG